jgi:membrane-bound lytic murein transglycosylase MltF
MKKNLLLHLTFLALVACGDSGSDVPAAAGDSAEPDQQSVPASSAKPMEAMEVPGREPPARRRSLEELQRDLEIPALSESWSGDLDGMAERRVIRVLTVYGLGRYFLDGPQEKGITFELFRAFEDFINQRLGTKTVRLHVVFIPVARNELISGLLEGRGDIAAAGLTITPARDELIDFTAPTTRALSEILVTGPSAPAIGSIEDLSGQKMYVRASSSYRSSLDALNLRFGAEGKAAIEIENISEYLEDEDLLEMVNAGLLPWVVVDDYKARIWVGVFDKLKARDDIVFRSGGQLAWAVRENSPELLFELNTFLKSHRQGTLKGNVLINRYIRDFDFASNALAANDYERFERVIEIFRKYGDQYGFDFLIVAAQGYQESRLDQSVRSRSGAVGIMQLLPSTAADKNVGIPDISKAEPNIHAGVKYMNFIRNRYFNDPEIDRFNQTLFALAAYNAGPARITRLRNKATQQGYDPNLWFDNVEIIAAKEIGRETVQYVANIIKYYVAYRMIVARQIQRGEERQIHGIDQGAPDQR